MKQPDEFPRRPRRLRLYGFINPLYFATITTRHRGNILACDRIHDAFQAFCVKAINYDIAVGRYVIMPDHIHLFLHMGYSKVEIGDWVGRLKRYLDGRLPPPTFASHWQEGVFEHLMRSRESYSEKWEYVRMNPVRAGLCGTPEDWPYAGEIQDISFV